MRSSSPPWRFVGFYGHHETMNRKHSWNLIRLISGLLNLATIFLGDFNEVLLSSEHVSQMRQRPNWQMKKFHQAVYDCGLFYVGYEGFPFTWCNNFISPHSTRARLDRCLATQHWKDVFPDAIISHLFTNNSDHLLILLNMGNQVHHARRAKKSFRFEDGWCLYEESKEVVKSAWDKVRDHDPGICLMECICNSHLGLLKLKREKLGHVQNTIKDKQLKLDELQRGVIKIASKGEATTLAKKIDKLREVDDLY
ncbi:hypothetical protein LIER_36094 [Lithospermum erythrorhizon]|uniref:Uncharacterized protein n=1 Tax=Lithospermum erythrorhizon TaxID=34254 RepID=A0AAV3P1A5_LITER